MIYVYINFVKIKCTKEDCRGEKEICCNHKFLRDASMYIYTMIQRYIYLCTVDK